MPTAMIPFSDAKRTMLSRLRDVRKTFSPLRTGATIAEHDEDGDEPEHALEPQQEADRLDERGRPATTALRRRRLAASTSCRRRRSRRHHRQPRRRRLHDPLLGRLGRGSARRSPARRRARGCGRTSPAARGARTTPSRSRRPGRRARSSARRSPPWRRRRCRGSARRGAAPWAGSAGTWRGRPSAGCRPTACRPARWRSAS